MDSTINNDDKSFIEKVKDGVTDLAQNIEHALGIGIVLPGEDNEERALVKVETDLVPASNLAESALSQTNEESFNIERSNKVIGSSQYTVNKMETNEISSLNTIQAERTNDFAEYARDLDKSDLHAEKARDKFVEGTKIADTVCEKAISEAQQDYFKIRQEYREGIEKAGNMYVEAQKDANKAQAKSDFYAELAVEKSQQGEEIAIILSEQIRLQAQQDELRAQQEYQENVKKAGEMYDSAQKEANKELDKSKQYAEKALQKLEEAKQKAFIRCEKAKETEQLTQIKTRETYEADVIKANEIFEAAQKEAAKAQEQVEYYTRKALETIQKGKIDAARQLEIAKEKADSESLKTRELYIQEVRKAGEEFYAAQKEVNKELEKSGIHAIKAEQKRQEGAVAAHNLLEKAEEKAQREAINTQLIYERGIANTGELYIAEQNEALKAQEKSEQYANIAVEKREEGKERAINMMENVAEKAQIETINAQQNYECNVQKAGQIYCAAQNEFNREQEKSDFYADKAEAKREQIVSNNMQTTVLCEPLVENPSMMINSKDISQQNTLNTNLSSTQTDRMNMNLNQSTGLQGSLNELPHAQNPNYRGINTVQGEPIVENPSMMLNSKDISQNSAKEISQNKQIVENSSVQSNTTNTTQNKDIIENPSMMKNEINTTQNSSRQSNNSMQNKEIVENPSMMDSEIDNLKQSMHDKTEEFHHTNKKSGHVTHRNNKKKTHTTGH